LDFHTIWDGAKISPRIFCAEILNLQVSVYANTTFYAGELLASPFYSMISYNLALFHKILVRLTLSPSSNPEENQFHLHTFLSACVSFSNLAYLCPRRPPFSGVPSSNYLALLI
jgi:hypothetical protein